MAQTPNIDGAIGELTHLSQKCQAAIEVLEGRKTTDFGWWKEVGIALEQIKNSFSDLDKRAGPLVRALSAMRELQP
jgi:hypothetical protein